MQKADLESTGIVTLQTLFNIKAAKNTTVQQPEFLVESFGNWPTLACQQVMIGPALLFMSALA